MKNVSTTIAVIFAAASCQSAWAQQPGPTKEEKEQPIDAERPGFTNGTGTVAPGHVQLEAGYLFTRSSDGTREHRLGDSTLLRIPTSATTEVRLGLPTHFFTHIPQMAVSASAVPSPTNGSSGGSDNTHGWGDSSLSAKWRFLDAPDDAPHKRPSFALIAQTTLPTGEPAYRETHLQPSLALESNYDVSDAWSVQADFVYARPADSGQQFTQYSGGLNVQHNFTETTAVFLETYRIAPTGFSAPNGNYLDGGITHVLGKNTQLDFNLGTGISSAIKNDRFVGVGVAHRW